MYRFPNDFNKEPHVVYPLTTHYKLLNSSNEILISIVGGAKGLYGDGITTFEMWDYREEEPKGYLTAGQINEHIKNNPF